MWGRVVVLALVVSTLGVAVSAAAPASPLVPGNALVAGRGYGQWLVAGWQWRLTQPSITSKRTSRLTAGQRGAVWFLGATRRVGTATCTIPAGRYLMLLFPGVDCSTVERAPFHAMTDAGLIRCARAEWRRAPFSETVTLDGVELRPNAHMAGTSAFAFTMPAHNNLLSVPGRTRGRIAVYAAASILRPLSPGTHTLVQVYHTEVSAHITYRLTVR